MAKSIQPDSLSDKQFQESFYPQLVQERYHADGSCTFVYVIENDMEVVCVG